MFCLTNKYFFIQMLMKNVIIIFGFAYDYLSNITLLEWWEVNKNHNREVNMGQPVGHR